MRMKGSVPDPHLRHWRCGLVDSTFSFPFLSSAVQRHNEDELLVVTVAPNCCPFVFAGVDWSLLFVLLWLCF